MAARLIDRNKQIPHGYKFLQPETGWRPPNFASFQVIINTLTAHRAGNPAMVAKHGWSLDPHVVAMEIEEFNVRLCQQMGWFDYITDFGGGEGIPPKSTAQQQQEKEQINVAAGRAQKIWAGVRTLNDWIDSNEPAVDARISERRAESCSKCPKNSAGDFSAWFTKPAAGAIKKQIEKLQDRKLSTPHDAILNICDVCLCPLKLKVHTPLPYIKAHLSDPVIHDLEAVGNCWIISELRGV